jgi:hypothetical protein
MKTGRLWYSFIAFMGIASLLIAASLKADDVYNFYFQKAPGPSTVYQSGGMPSTNNAAQNPNTVIQNGVQSPPGAPPQTNPVVVPPADGQNSTKAEVSKPSDDKGFSRWEIFLGKNSFGSGVAELGAGTSTYSSASMAGEWVLGVQFNIWKNFGIEAQVMQPSGQSIVFSGPGSTLDYSGELVFTPFHITVASFDVLDLGFVGGYTSIPVGYVPMDYYGGGYYSPYAGHPSTYFVGAKAAVNIGSTFAIVGEANELPEENLSRLTFGVKFKL